MTSNINNHINNTNTIVAGVDAFRCPINNCCSRVVKIPTDVAKHILDRHPTIASHMHLSGRKYAKAYFCDTCTKYSNAPHAVCYECGIPENGGEVKCFRTAAERDQHLKDEHCKWWYEYDCKWGKKCHGISGGCGFKHVPTEKRYITNDEPIPKFVCRYDRPWDNVRCTDDECSYVHFWGRVRALIKMRANKTRKNGKTKGKDNMKTESDELNDAFCEDCDNTKADGSVVYNEDCVQDCDHGCDCEQDCDELSSLGSPQMYLTPEKTIIVDIPSAPIKIRRIAFKFEDTDELSPISKADTEDDNAIEEQNDWSESDDNSYLDDYDGEFDEEFINSRAGIHKSSSKGGQKSAPSPYTSKHVRAQSENIARGHARNQARAVARGSKAKP